MLDFLLRRPIAVGMSFLGLLVLSLLSLRQLPLSLLPDTDIPELVVRLQYPNASAMEVEQNALRPLRDGLTTLPMLQDMESEAYQEGGILHLYFDYGTDMRLAYMEASEKLDQLRDQLPEDLPRPLLSKVNAADLPMVRLQVFAPDERLSMLELSRLASVLVRKRLETLPGVSLVDVGGRQQQAYLLQPYRPLLQRYGVSETWLWQQLQAHHRPVGSLSVREGHYRYLMELSEQEADLQRLRELPIPLPSGQHLPLASLVDIRLEAQQPSSVHLYNGRQALVLNLHKQEGADLLQVMQGVREAVSRMEQDHPQLRFALTQDQSYLLHASLENLWGALWVGGLAALGVLFFFMGHYRIPLLIAITLPSSLLLGFLLFYLAGISLNVVSLAGIALGAGMLIDNGIIVIDNISTHWRANGRPGLEGLLQACVSGTQAVYTPLLSSVLTTLAVFLPLVFMDGLAGTLFAEQAIAVASTLIASLLVAFLLLPLCYLTLFRTQHEHRQLSEGRLFAALRRRYAHLHSRLLRHPWLPLSVLLLSIPLVWGGYTLLPKRLLPPMQQDALLLHVDWNEPLTLAENCARLRALEGHFAHALQAAEADAGQLQFHLAKERGSAQQAWHYWKLKSPAHYGQVVAALPAYLSARYPVARWQLKDAPNAFTQMMQTDARPYWEVRYRHALAAGPLPPAVLQQPVAQMRERGGIPAKGTQRVPYIDLHIRQQVLARYGVGYGQLLATLEQVLGDQPLMTLSSFGERIPLRLQVRTEPLAYLLQSNTLQVPSGAHIPLSAFVDYSFSEGYQVLTADRKGIYHGVQWHALSDAAADSLQRLSDSQSGGELLADAVGRYYQGDAQARRMIGILLLSVLLLYFILSAQFESFIQPFYVLCTLPAGILGSLLLLWAGGQDLNIMSGIGMVVMMGVMVNDAILKVDTLNRLRDAHPHWPVHRLLEEAGTLRLRPILMTTATTVLALLPILFTDGLGAELQQPLALAVIGGLSVGTATALFSIPAMYALVEGWRMRMVKPHAHEV